MQCRLGMADRAGHNTDTSKVDRRSVGKNFAEISDTRF
jgi:hypothetical protein